jgi:hypothetical protein
MSNAGTIAVVLLTQSQAVTSATRVLQPTILNHINKPYQPNNIMNLNKSIKILIGAVFAAGMLVQAKAQDATAAAKPVDPSGTYIWTMQGRNGGPTRTNTLVLKWDGTNLTGNVTSPRRGGQTSTTDIANGKVTGADVSFVVVRTFNDNTFTNTYTGTVSDTAIKGKVEFTRDGDTQSRDWDATKQ